MLKPCLRAALVLAVFVLLMTAAQEPAPAPAPAPAPSGGDPAVAVGGGLIAAYQAYLDDQLWKWYAGEVKTEDLPCDVLRYIRSDLVWWFTTYQEEINDIDNALGILTNGMNGGDNPQAWEPYPEGMTSEQFLAALQVLRDYEYYITGGSPPIVPPDQYNTFLLMLTLRHLLGTGWEAAFQALGYGYWDYYFITDEYINNIVKLLAGISNANMEDVTKWCMWLKDLDAQINMRCGGNPGADPCPACGTN